MKKYEKECPNMETQFKQMMDMARNSEKTMNPDKPFPSFDSQKEFVMNQCPKFPDGTITYFQVKIYFMVTFCCRSNQTVQIAYTLSSLTLFLLCIF
jgi:hypothetical protein